MEIREPKKIQIRWIRCAWVLAVVWILIGIFSVKSYAALSEQIVYEGPVFIMDEKEIYPDEVLEQNGKQYRRISVEERIVEKEGNLTYVSTVVPCQLEGTQVPPELATLTLVFDITGEEYQREVSLLEIREKNAYWVDDFSFTVTVYGYDAEVFYLGEYEVPVGSDLTDYGSHFLEYLELPMDCYRVDRVEWNGESYEAEGIICRDAVAYGKKLVRDIEAVYGGQVRTPKIPGKQYVAVYEEIIEKPTEEETTLRDLTVSESITEKTSEAEDAFEAKSDVQNEGSFSERIVRWLEDHVTVIVFSILFLFCLASGLFLLWKAGKARD